MFNHKQNNTTLGNDIGPDGAKCISEGLKENSGLRTLDIGCKSSNTTTKNHKTFIANDIKYGARALGDALKTNTTLTELNLY